MAAALSFPHRRWPSFPDRSQPSSIYKRKTLYLVVMASDPKIGVNYALSEGETINNKKG